MATLKDVAKATGGIAEQRFVHASRRRLRVAGDPGADLRDHRERNKNTAPVDILH